MPHANGKIYTTTVNGVRQGVNTDDVSAVLGKASHDAKTLCTADNINIFAAFKPFEMNKPESLTDNEIWRNGYGLRAFKFQGTASAFAKAMETNMKDEEWMAREGLSYQKVTTFGRLTDFVSSERDNVGYYTGATLDAGLRGNGTWVEFEPSTSGDLIDATSAISDQTMTVPDWSLLENWPITRSDTNANLLDVLESTIANPHTNYLNIKAKKRGVMVMTPHWTNPHFSIGTIPWKTWLSENSASGGALTDVSNPTSENLFPVVDFLTEYTGTTMNANTSTTFYVIYAGFQRIKLDFVVYISINKNPSNGKFEIFVTLDGVKFNQLTSPSLRIGFWNNNTFDLFTSPSISSVNSSQYYWEGTVGDYLGTLRVIFSCKRRDGTIKEVYEDWY